MREHMKSLTHRQIADILGLLDQHCLKNDEGHCRYVGNWTDKMIAETVHCHLDQVARVRRVNGFGRIVKNERVVNDDVRLRSLVTVVADLIERLGDRELAARVRELNGGGE